MFGVHRFIDPDLLSGDELEVGQVVEISAAIDNPLTPGRYFLRCFVTSAREGGGVAVGFFDLLDFVVFGVNPEHGIVSVDAQMWVVPVEAAERDGS